MDIPSLSNDICIPLNSEEGKKLYKDALTRSDSFLDFKLISKFRKQAGAHTCAIVSSGIVLDSLYDLDEPSIYNEKNFFELETIKQIDLKTKINKSGLTLVEILDLFEKLRLNIDVFKMFACQSSLEQFRAQISLSISNNQPTGEILHDIVLGPTHSQKSTSFANTNLLSFLFAPDIAISSNSTIQLNASLNSAIIVNYQPYRLALTDKTWGHFSPLVALHAPSDRALIMDVHPTIDCCWVKLGELFESMMTVDAASGKSRGWLVVSRS